MPRLSLHQLLRLALGGQIHHRVARGGLQACWTLDVHEAIRFDRTVPAISARERVLAREGQSAAADAADTRRAGMEVFGQSTASDAEAALRAHAADSDVLAPRRSGARPVLRLRLDAAGREAARPFLHRYRTGRTPLRSRVNTRFPPRRVTVPTCQLLKDRLKSVRWGGTLALS